MRVLWGFNGRIEALKIGCRFIVTIFARLNFDPVVNLELGLAFFGGVALLLDLSSISTFIHTTTMSLLNRVWSAFRPTIQTALSQSSATRPAGFSLPANAGSMR